MPDPRLAHRRPGRPLLDPNGPVRVDLRRSTTQSDLTARGPWISRVGEARASPCTGHAATVAPAELSVRIEERIAREGQERKTR